MERLRDEAKKAKDVSTKLTSAMKHVASLEDASAWAEVKIQELEAEVATAEEAMQNAEQQIAHTEREHTETERLLALETAKTAPKRGRPVGHRGAEYLLDHWDDYARDASRQAFWRHCHDIKHALEAAGIDDWLPSALAHVLDSMSAGEDGSWVDQLNSSRPFSKRKCELIASLHTILQSEWNLDLSQHALVEVGLSERQYQELRNAFSKSLFTPINTTVDSAAAGMYSKRPWYICPVLGTTFNLPEPLMPMYRVQEQIKKAVEPLGLKL